ncbi:MAG: LytR C-terminal domain-containing protein [Elusimicrobiota bacterium]|jgi:hypothetical protein|nr:LytR C-terminal domain-containing protein [Elusimicrobiota bacterium]
MFLKNKKHLIYLFVLIAFILVYLSFFNTGRQIKKIWFGQDIKIAVLIYGSEDVLPKNLEAFYIYINTNSRLVKVLSINTDIKINAKQTLSQSFFSAAKKDLAFAKENLFANLEILSANHFKPDYYFAATFKDISQMLILTGKPSKLILMDEFKNLDDKEITQLIIAELLLDRMSRFPLVSSLSFMRNLKHFDTNLSKSFFINLSLFFAIYKNEIFFCIFPVRRTSAGVQLLKDDIANFFNNVFLQDADNNEGRLDGFVEVRNASNITGAAQNAAWRLRMEELDVLDFGNWPISADETIIKDRKGNFMQAKKIAKVLGVGKIINAYDEYHNYDTTVFIGQDYKIKDTGEMDEL